MNKYIISLTTIPSKFDNLYLTMDSILNQTIKPSKIIINMPNNYNFRFQNSVIPLDKINNFIDKYSKSNIIINFVDKDYGPGTKLVGLFKNNVFDTIINTIIKMDETTTDTYIVLVDDDLIYKPYMIEYFDNYIKQNDTIEVASYWTFNYYNLKIGQGADGFFIKVNNNSNSNILTNFLNYYNLIKDEDYINYHDDFYISYYFYLINKNIHYIKPPYDCLIYDLQPNSYIDPLCKLEGKYNRQNLNVKSYEILNNFKNSGLFDLVFNIH